MYSKLPNWVLGFHGCNKAVCEEILQGNSTLEPSKNSYDWLGHGIYFWENNYERALEWAEDGREEPAVIGAVIDLGYCLNLVEARFLQFINLGYNTLKQNYENANLSMPENRKHADSIDLVIRNLDCAVIETIHAILKADKQTSFDSVRAVFFEGKEPYKDSGFREKNHIQICIRNPNCIKGYFRPLTHNNKYPKP